MPDPLGLVPWRRGMKTCGGQNVGAEGNTDRRCLLIRTGGKVGRTNEDPCSWHLSSGLRTCDLPSTTVLSVLPQRRVNLDHHSRVLSRCLPPPLDPSD